MTEAQLQAAVIEMAQTFKWRCYHTHDSRRSQAGFPDLVLVRDRVIFAELKRENGAVRPEQAEWLDALRSAALGGATIRVHLWRPSDWISGAIERILRGSRFDV